MKNSKILIANTRLILKNEEIYGSLLIEDGKISEIIRSGLSASFSKNDVTLIDASGMIVIPGLIDIHSDAIEKEIQPRPNTLFPVRFSLIELEKKLAAGGITTMYHSISLSDDWGMRDGETCMNIIREIRALNHSRPMINHRVHLRYEIGFTNGADYLEELVGSRLVDLVSYMDHTPGQGQFQDPEMLKRFMIEAHGMKTDETETFIDRINDKRKKVDVGRLYKIAELAARLGISLATHDDDNEGKIDLLQYFQGRISEFPINIETASYAAAKGLHVCVGAPNLIRGGSHSNNMKALDAITAKAADIICSDYLPSCMLPAAMLLTGYGLSLPEAIAMVTANPAAATGIAGERGSIEEGKDADLVMFEMDGKHPMVRMTMTAGHVVYRADYIKSRARESREVLC